MEESRVSQNVIKLIIFFLFSLQKVQYAHSQDTPLLTLEPEFNVVFTSEDPWTYTLGVGQRGTLSPYHTQHLEINHYTQYSWSSKLKAALGVRYRMREIFDHSNHDEIRFIEEMKYKQPNWSLQPEHRIRFEQRIEDMVRHRFRYEFGITQPITKHFSGVLATEALLTVARRLKPATEQRFEFGIENTSFENLKIGLGFEYRLDNYLQELQREYFISTGATLFLD